MRPTPDEHVSVNPQMVILARESRGMQQAALATALGVTQGRISKIEAGLLPVTDELLDRLSHVLRYPRGFFFQNGGITGIGVAEVFHRKRRDVPAKIMSKVDARVEIRLRHIAALLRAADIQWDVPRLDPDEYDGNIEDIAEIVRARLKVPRGPIPNLVRVLEDAGIVVVPFDFETPRIDAMSKWVPGLPPVFFVNHERPADRCRFSLAHELAHVCMHALPTPDMEKEADQFAGAFLLPARDVRADLYDLTLPRLAVLKQKWRVSMQALLMRAEALNTITEGRKRALWAQMGRLGYKTREPAELDIAQERPELLKELIDLHRHDLGYSVAELEELLNLFSDELRDTYLRDPYQPRLSVVQSG